MKNKTILAIAFFAISLLIIPQMTFASLWKPNTWKIFNRKFEVKTEQKIIATSTPNNVISQTQKATITPTVSRSSGQSVGAEKIEQKSEEARKPKATSSFADTSAKKNDQSKEIEKLQKQIEDLKQKVEKQSNENLKLDTLPVNIVPSNTVICNGKYWTECPVGQKFYCPETGDAQCLIENNGLNSMIESPVLKIEKCKAIRDSDRTKMLEESRQLVEEGLRKFQDQLLQQFYSAIPSGTVTAGEIMTTLVVPQIKTKREKDMQAMTTAVDVYLNNEYAKCLNK